MVNCWAQEYAARPSAQDIVSLLQSPDCLKLSNVYNTELPYSTVSAALVVTIDNDEQLLWLAHGYKIDVYKFFNTNNPVDFLKVTLSSLIIINDFSIIIVK